MSEKYLQFLRAVTSLPSFHVVCVYLLIILVSGRIIKLFQPWDLRQVMIWYNASCSIANLLVVGLFLRGYSTGDYTTIYDKSASPAFGSAFYGYAVLKWVELLDTMFMILRHRQRQISFLHVYHHASILLLGDITNAVYPWTGIALVIALNSFVHVCLYTYYALAAAFPENPPQWKKQITQIQIAQFLIGMVYTVNGYVNHGFCIYGPIYGLSMTILFVNFYLQAYGGKTKKS